MSCDINFCDYVNCQSSGSYTFDTELTEGSHVFTITNRQRSFTFSSSVVDGKVSIDVDDFPEGFFNPYSGPYVLATTGCYDSICGIYSSITFEVRNGEGKTHITCPCVAQ